MIDGHAGNLVPRTSWLEHGFVGLIPLDPLDRYFEKFTFRMDQIVDGMGNETYTQATDDPLLLDLARQWREHLDGPLGMPALGVIDLAAAAPKLPGPAVDQGLHNRALRSHH